MPETTNYMILGYIVVVVILAATVLYLVLKARNLRAELQMLESLDEEGNQPTTAANQTKGQRDAILNKS
jgi:hypothetical protein